MKEPLLKAIMDRHAKNLWRELQLFRLFQLVMQLVIQDKIKNVRDHLPVFIGLRVFLNVADFVDQHNGRTREDVTVPVVCNEFIKR
jgi:hypothetical protein